MAYLREPCLPLLDSYVPSFSSQWDNLTLPNCEWLWHPWVSCVESDATSQLVNSVQLLSHVQLFVTPWTAACQNCLSITNSQNLFKLMPIESVMPSNHLILCHPLLLPPSIFPRIMVFLNESFFVSGGQSVRVSASTSVLPMNTQDWSLGWTGWISLQSKGLSWVFSNTTVQKHQFFGAQLSL